jgi:hypothetical protein
VIRAVGGYLGGDDLRFLMELSIEPVAAKLRPPRLGRDLVTSISLVTFGFGDLVMGPEVVGSGRLRRQIRPGEGQPSARQAH